MRAVYQSKETDRYRSDLQFRIAKTLRNRLYTALKGKFRTGSAVRNLGCSIPELKIYLESKFQEGMTWQNWGKGPGTWNIDHRVLLASFDLTSKEQLLKACHYTNLQPLWWEENIRKTKVYLMKEMI